MVVSKVDIFVTQEIASKLEETGNVEKFVANVTKNVEEVGLLESLNKQGGRHLASITSAFVWGDTPEGGKYWEELAAEVEPTDIGVLIRRALSAEKYATVQIATKEGDK